MRKHHGYRLLLLVLFGICSGASCGAPAGGQPPAAARATGVDQEADRPAPTRPDPGQGATSGRDLGPGPVAGDGASRPPAPPPMASGADTDGDGVPDAQDQCPSVPEDRDGFEDEDGCPDPDNDRDGIPDVQDKCPNEPEDRDGHQDEDGCPDP